MRLSKRVFQWSLESARVAAEFDGYPRPVDEEAAGLPLLPFAGQVAGGRKNGGRRLVDGGVSSDFEKAIAAWCDPTQMPKNNKKTKKTCAAVGSAILLGNARAAG